MRQQVCTIIGAKEGGSAWIPELEHLAHEAGYAAAREGYVVLTGGHSGVMTYAARGAKQGEGVTVGILRTELKTDANPYIDLVLPSGMGVGRNVLTALASDVVIALRGSMGTLQELAFALDFGRPVIGWGYWAEFSTRGLRFLPHDTLVPDIDEETKQLREWLRAQKG